MSLRKPGSRQRDLINRLINGERFRFDPLDSYTLPVMYSGKVGVVVDRKLAESLVSSGYIEKISDSAGMTSGWVVTEDGIKALEK